jgi:hypothetical protein
MKRLALLAVVGVVLVVAAALGIPALAHEGREVGEVEIVFGWRVEPAYTGIFNGPEFTVKMHGDAHGEHEPEATAEADHSDSEDHSEDEGMVAGLEETLQLEVSYGGQSKMLRLRAMFGQPGHYTADLIPTQPGDYIFRLFGTIGDLEIDETFSSAEGAFSSVEPISDIQFP